MKEQLMKYSRQVDKTTAAERLYTPALSVNDNKTWFEWKARSALAMTVFLVYEQI